MVTDIVARILGGVFLGVAGWGLGGYITDIWGPERFVLWAFGFAVSGGLIGLILTPFVLGRIYSNVAEQTHSVPTSRMLSGIVGVIMGLLVALLFSVLLWRIPGWPGVTFPIVLSLLLAYLGGMIMFSPSRDLFQKFVSGHPTHSLNGDTPQPTGNQAGLMLIDTSAIIDGRIASVSQTGFLQGTLVIPRFVLNELRHVADSGDSVRRARGRRGLEILNQIRMDGKVHTEVLEIDYPRAMDVDAKLVGLAKDMGASIVTTDFNLNRVAQIDGITVLNVNELAGSLRPVVIPGENMQLRIIQEGTEAGQGVGFLEDGTMVVVESGARYLDTELTVTATRILQTAAGRIIFAQPAKD
jgi:uncharacterized protein YacL